MAVGLGVLLAGAALAQDAGKIAWRIGPKEADINEVYPVEAGLKRQNGMVKLRCDGAADGRLANCLVAAEDPTGAGFGAAALQLADKYRLAPGQVRSGIEVPVEFFIKPPPTAEDLELPVLVRSTSEAERFEAWPEEARALGLGGGVQLQCVVDEQGLLRACEVTGERWPGLGFGAAALSLARSYRYIPANRAGRPTAVRMPVSIEFECGARCTPLDRSSLRTDLAVKVPWVSAPTPAQMAAAYPAAAKAAGVQGKVILDCRLRADGGLRDCRGKVVEPAGQGFLEAAQSLAPLFKAPTGGANRFTNAQVLLPISFQGGGAKTGRPDWRLRPTPSEFNAAFPKQALAAGAGGRGVLDCQVAQLGLLTGCSIAGEEPAGMGFGSAALSLAPRFSMTLWSPDGLPTLGARVRAPITFDAPVKLASTPIPTITNPEWARRPTGIQLANAFPVRAMRMEMSGQVRLKCVVTATGDVTNCRVLEESPTGYGFGQAAIALAAYFRMKPMMVDGRPVMPGGAEVEFPVGFRLQ